MSNLLRQTYKRKTLEQLQDAIKADEKRLDEINRLLNTPEIKEHPRLEQSLRDEKQRTDVEVLDKKHEIQIRKLNKLNNPDNE